MVGSRWRSEALGSICIPVSLQESSRIEEYRDTSPKIKANVKHIRGSESEFLILSGCSHGCSGSPLSTNLEPPQPVHEH
ncbi:hypothetical protein DPEC_G00049270 [Dallia pectoralis]|uniref:Uncharacterized protein n=1 Tax=Dallia pectoralis TaxID=75939 RepID=A0ACC2HAL8_DALPE|nr:hypothetical protein DPEC_G00049270 [Dallia pectoralis]